MHPIIKRQIGYQADRELTFEVLARTKGIAQQYKLTATRVALGFPQMAFAINLGAHLAAGIVDRQRTKHDHAARRTPRKINGRLKLRHGILHRGVETEMKNEIHLRGLNIVGGWRRAAFGRSILPHLGCLTDAAGLGQVDGATQVEVALQQALELAGRLDLERGHTPAVLAAQRWPAGITRQRCRGCVVRTGGRSGRGLGQQRPRLARPNRRSTRGTIAAAGAFDHSGFRAYVESRDLPREFPGVRGFAVIERVMRSDLARFVAAQRADQAPDFAVRSSGAAPDLYLIK